MTDIIKVSDAIDSLLDRPLWTRREFAFYDMLVSKVRQYRDRLPKAEAKAKAEGTPRVPKDISGDISDIYNNIIVQPWYVRSNNQGTIAGLFQNTKILDCQHLDTDNYHYRLELTLNDRIHLIMEVARDARSKGKSCYHFRVYFEQDGSYKGHIAAFTPGKSKGHVLPEYDQLTRMFPSLEKHEIIYIGVYPTFLIGYGSNQIIYPVSTRLTNTAVPMVSK